MDDFFDHPVKRQTVFELEEELTRIEVEEEDDRGFGKEPSPELIEVSCGRNLLMEEKAHCQVAGVAGCAERVSSTCGCAGDRLRFAYVGEDYKGEGEEVC